MSEKADDKAAELVRLAKRGGRVEEVRTALGMSGEEFANAINERAADRGYEAGYDKSKVSRLESGKVTYLPAEEAVVIAMLDPEKRGVAWLVFGGRRAAKPIAKPAAAATSSRHADKREAK